MSLPRYALRIAGRVVEEGSRAVIRSPFSGEPVAEVYHVTPALMEEALQDSVAAFERYRKVSRYTRARLLSVIAREIGVRRAEIADSIVREAGKPWTLADAEVGRAIQTFTIASEEAKRLGGDVVPVDLDPAARAFRPAVSYWVPKGPVLAITPFNFPLNLVAHKVAPALAAGCSVLLKPAPQAPGAAFLLADIVGKAIAEVSDERDAVPGAVLQVVAGPNEVVGTAVTDPRIAVLSFTGSDRVGFMLQEKAVRKRVLLELGGNAAVIVHSDADLARAAARCAFGAFAYAGQVCISVQRILVQKEALGRFQDLFLGEVAKIQSGDPSKKEVLVGPLIDSGAADRVQSWIDEAQKDGARVITGGSRAGNLIAPTVVSGAKAHHKLTSEEAFGPVVTLDSYDRLEEAFSVINSSRFGLQAGLFTESARVIDQAVQALDVGGLIVNEVPTYRADNMPYGGVKESGLGREGVRYAIEEFSERKTVVQWVG